MHSTEELSIIKTDCCTVALLSSTIHSIPPACRGKPILKPHFSSFEGDSESVSSVAKKKAKVKKSREPLNYGECLMFEHHQRIRSKLQKCFEEVIKFPDSNPVFSTSTTTTANPSTDKGVTATCDKQESSREIKDQIFKFSSLDLASICDVNKLVLYSSVTDGRLLLKDAVVKCDDVFGRIVENHFNDTVVLEAMQCRFHIPCRSSFLLSDISKLDPLLDYCSQEAVTFDIVLLDPPWDNRSLKRLKKKTRYSSLSLFDISAIPLPSLLSDDAIVIVWVTNRRSLVERVRDFSFPKWNVEFITEWQWLKVALNKEMVFELDSIHRKPYETLVVGRYRQKGSLGGKALSPPVLHSRFDIPANLVICSVPTSIHSQKPHIGPVIKHCLMDKTKHKGDQIYCT